MVIKIRNIATVLVPVLIAISITLQSFYIFGTHTTPSTTSSTEVIHKQTIYAQYCTCNPQNFLVLIKAGAKAKYQQRRKVWRDSACPASYAELNMTYHFMLALPAHEMIDPNSHNQKARASEEEIEDMRKLKYESSVNKDMVFLSMKDVYEDFYLKTLRIFEYAVDRGMADETSVVVIHDDEYCLRPELLQTICEDAILSNSSVYAGTTLHFTGGHHKQAFDDGSYAPYFDGHMYALSSDLMRDIAYDHDTTFTSMNLGSAEDLQVGKWVKNQVDREDNPKLIKLALNTLLLWKVENHDPDISCGNHRAPSCAECPQCKGDCVLSDEEEGEVCKEDKTKSYRYPETFTSKEKALNNLVENLAGGADSFWTQCAAYTPECESAQVIKTKWHYGKDDYNQIKCCKEHRFIRDSMTELWGALDHFNVTAWMDHGSAIGVARHGGTQVPWDYDGDIAVLMDFDEKAGNWYPNKHPPLILHDKDEANKWLDRLVSYVFDKQQQRAKGKKNVEMHEKWSYHFVHFDERCVQMQLHVPGGRLDLFGVRDQSRKMTKWSDKMEVKMIDNILRQPVNYFGCFQKKSNHNEHSFYTYPPVPCTFYGKQVWCARDNEQYLKHYYGENVMHSGVSHDGFYGSHWTPSAGDGI